MLLSYSPSDSGSVFAGRKYYCEAHSHSLSHSLLTGLVGAPASVSAAPILYNIHFTTSGIGLSGIGPSSGSFLYDSATTRFASFTVQWNSLSFDLTSSANAPKVSGACDTANPNSADFFSYLMSGYTGCRLNDWGGGGASERGSGWFGNIRDRRWRPFREGVHLRRNPRHGAIGEWGWIFYDLSPGELGTRAFHDSAPAKRRNVVGIEV